MAPLSMRSRSLAAGRRRLSHGSERCRGAATVMIRGAATDSRPSGPDAAWWRGTRTGFRVVVLVS
jgi:hypothetical protein